MIIPEILNSICALLPISDLKKARFICHTWDAAAQRYLFETVTLRLNLMSYANLQNISRHPNLQFYVKFIIYDLRTIQEKAPSNICAWIISNAGRGLGLHQSIIKNLITQLNQQQLDKCYQRYCQYLHGQEYIMDQANEVDILELIVRRLPHLKGIQYYYEKKTIKRDLGPIEFSSLSLIAQEMLAEPDAYIGQKNAERRFWGLLARVCFIRGRPVEELCLPDFKILKWISPDLRQHFAEECQQTVPYLQRLSLTTFHSDDAYDMYDDDDDDIFGLKYLVAETSDLKSLGLTIYDDEHGLPLYIYLDPIIGEKQWNHLSHLHLDGYTTSKYYLQRLLLRHISSLRSLSFANMKFANSESWISFIIFLNEHMRLRYVSFQGRFFNSENKSWAVASTGSGNCLKRRIESFATRCCPCPFRSRELLVGEESCSWVVDDDESWRSDDRRW